MPNNQLPIVAIVGQPNVGKSTLMNKIAGQPLAVTSDIAGTTRDRQYADTAWNGANFTLVDTAGLSLESKDELEHSLNKQIDIALGEADMVMLVVDGRLNSLAVERTTLQKFRKIKKPVFLVINKVDSLNKREEKMGEFQRLGIKPVFPVSAISGRGLGDMLDYIAEELKKMKPDDAREETNAGISVGIIGKPNVGKSSIFNQILKEERVVVSPIAGTTRTAIDSHLVIDGQDYTFIDTAGLKKKEHRQAQPDIFSGFQTFKSIRRSDVCFFVVDSLEELTKQDQRVAQEIFAQDKGCIILANKIDLYKAPARGGASAVNERGGKRKNDDEHEALRDYVSMHFPFLWMCPVFFVSGKTGKGLEEAINAIKPIYERRHKTVSDEQAQEFLQKQLKINPPKLLRDQKEPKVYSLKQIASNPPLFELYVNHPAAISTQFRKFIQNGITKELDFYGTPVNLKLRGKDKT